MTVAYSDLKIVDKKVDLAKELLEESGARLSMEQIQEILNWSFTGGKIAGLKEQDESFGDFDLTDVSVSVKVAEAREFAQALRLKDWEMSHSWAGDDVTREWGFLVAGDAVFGQSYSYSYSNNGNLESDEQNNVDGNFDLNKVQVVLVNRENHDHFNGNHQDEDFWTLYVYIPGGKLIDDEAYELGQRLGFLGKFAVSAV